MQSDTVLPPLRFGSLECKSSCSSTILFIRVSWHLKRRIRTDKFIEYSGKSRRITSCQQGSPHGEWWWGDLAFHFPLTAQRGAQKWSGNFISFSPHATRQKMGKHSHEEWKKGCMQSHNFCQILSTVIKSWNPLLQIACVTFKWEINIFRP